LVTEKPVHVDITLKSGIWIEPTKFFKQIEDAGYGARKEDVRLTLTGKINKVDDRLLLTVDDMKPESQTFVLVEGKSKKEKEMKALSDAFKETGIRVDQTVEIEGVWKAPSDKKDKAALPTLTVMRVITPKPKEESK
jgi:hypothetical protein